MLTWRALACSAQMTVPLSCVSGSLLGDLDMCEYPHSLHCPTRGTYARQPALQQLPGFLCAAVHGGVYGDPAAVAHVCQFYSWHCKQGGEFGRGCPLYSTVVTAESCISNSSNFGWRMRKGAVDAAGTLYLIQTAGLLWNVGQHSTAWCVGVA
jgi:hypothetical protein